MEINNCVASATGKIKKGWTADGTPVGGLKSIQFCGLKTVDGKPQGGQCLAELIRDGQSHIEPSTLSCVGTCLQGLALPQASLLLDNQ